MGKSDNRFDAAKKAVKTGNAEYYSYSTDNYSVNGIVQPSGTWLSQSTYSDGYSHHYMQAINDHEHIIASSTICISKVALRCGEYLLPD